MKPTYEVDDLVIPPFRPSAMVPSASSSSRSTATQHNNNNNAPNIQKAGRPEQRLGQYKIIKTIGEGSFGKVKLAIHSATGQEVALKIIGKKNLTSKDMVGRVEREIAYLQLLRHPHIIKLYTVITTPTDIIMVIEYAGKELFDFLVTNGRAPEAQARRFFQQIICAVEYCHRHKIVHRDLKPENLLLDENHNVKIADFGLSNIMTDGNFLKTSCGSPNYAAPEVISGKLYAGPEVDVWSCGVILYVLLCGRLPFDDEYIPSLFKKISQGKYSIPEYLSPGATNLIQKMLVVNPVDRITIAEIRKHEWFQTNLPEYLHPPKEEFVDTGFDPSKLPPSHWIESGPAERLKGELHDQVVGKLGSTMGYGKDDVQNALSTAEPSTIKDAYLIVRENQMMIPTLSKQKNDGFVAQSPPAWDETYLPVSPQPFRGFGNNSRTASPLVLPQRDGSGLGITSEAQDNTPQPQPPRSPVTSIGVLHTSLPAYHKALMQGSKPDRAVDSISHKPMAQRVAQGTTTRRPRGLAKQRWQFGIRSKNSPMEAISCIYAALRKMGAEWVSPAQPPVDYHEAHHPDSDDSPDSSTASSSSAEPHKDQIDPWVIACRWKKYAPISATTTPVSSTPSTPRSPNFPKKAPGDWVYVHMTIQLYQVEDRNYVVDFKCGGYERIPQEDDDSQQEHEEEENGEKTQTPRADGKKRVMFDDSAIEHHHHHAEPSGKKDEGSNSSDSMSPFPFLDLAGQLIGQLAEAAT